MTAELTQTLAAAVPIVLLIGVGALIRAAGILTESGIAEIKSLIVKVALPAVLFSAFLTMEIDTSYLGILVLVPIILTVLLLLGYALQRPLGGRPSFPFLTTGFEFGMIGIPLFATAYGIEQIGAISMFGLPHEFFIWFLYVTLMQIRYAGRASFARTLRSFAANPIVTAIVAGAVLNLSGAGDILQDWAVLTPVFRSIDLLGSVVSPLILIVIGFGIRISLPAIRQALPVLLLRFSVTLALALAAAPWLMERVFGLDRIFTHAMVTFLILPPPYIVPLYVPADQTDDLAYSNNVLSIYTVLSIVTFLVYFWFNPS